VCTEFAHEFPQDVVFAGYSVQSIMGATDNLLILFIFMAALRWTPFRIFSTT
jgi:hypothetical protein